MSLVIVERALEEPREFSGFQALESAVRGCLLTYRVRPLRAFVARDRHNMICLYDAPDAESVRETQRAAGLPVSHVWAGLQVVDRPQTLPAGYSLVLVQREAPEGTTPELLEYFANDPKGCNGRLRIKHVAVFASHDCRRVCCLYHAPDLESVRAANQETGAPYERLWVADVFEAPAPISPNA